ncbi:NCS2 family permease [Desulfuromonas thiophila]|uniref:NCS2 family permease n=1 Tax=Desulfuromonas thiophila TaxID=57664 RepID=UPI0029F47622|nr:NCS2 family permease [Desulfuromonas thiophila]
MKSFFALEQQQTCVKTEVLAGITSFLAAMYIIIVNPAIISAAGMPFNGVVTATVLVSAFSSILMGLYARNPILVAPGMGINAFFTYTVVLGMGVPWPVALGAVFWSGVIFLLLSLFNVRSTIAGAIPHQIRAAVAAGIGLFITFIGLQNARFVVDDAVTLVRFGGLNVVTLTFLAGLMVSSWLVLKRVSGALILGIATTTLLASAIGRVWGDASTIVGTATPVTWSGLIAAPDFSLLLALDLKNSLTLAMLPVIFVMLFADLFDSLSTFIGVAEAADLKDSNGEPRNIRQSLLTDAVATTLSGLCGTSAGSSFIESAAGIREGGRTGLTAVVAGLCFLPFMFFSPLLSMIPAFATAPALVLVGVFMMSPISTIDWQRYDEAIPAFLAIILIPLTTSITQGIVWGLICWTGLKLLSGQRVQVSKTLLAINLFALAVLLI